MSDNRIAGYIDSPLRLSPGEYIVSGNWIASTLRFGEDYVIRHYRNEMLVGTWKISSVLKFTTKTGPKVGLKVTSDNKFAYFQVGDIVVDHELNIEFYNIKLDNDFNDSSIVGNILGNESNKAIIYSGISGLTLAALSYETISLQNEFKVNSVKGINEVIVLGKQGIVDEENPLEVRVDSKPKILLTELLNTMNPLRSFIVGIAKEYTNNSKAKILSTMYEPAVELKAGSIRLLLAPNNEGQLSMYDLPTGLPYELLYKIIATANRGDINSVIQIMSGNFINVRKHMYNLLSLVRPFYRKGLLEISLKGYEKIRVNENTYRTIKNALELILSREVVITGLIYAIDTKRNWFRITDSETDVDWKIVYNQQAIRDIDLSILTKGNVKVFATTFSPEEAKRGIAEYINHDFI